MYGCESWTIKKAEHRRIDAFELWCWRRLLRVPWTARRSNQSILRISVLSVHWKDWCWSWNSNTLATWCKELTHLKRPWCWERLRAGGEGDDRRWDGCMASPTQWTWVWVNSRSCCWTGKPGVLQSCCCCCCCQVTSVMSDSVLPHRWQPRRLPYPWDFPGKCTRVGCHCLLRFCSPWGCKESDMTEWLNNNKFRIARNGIYG